MSLRNRVGKRLQESVRRAFFGPRREGGGEFMSLDEMARRSDATHRNKLHTNQIMAANYGVFVLCLCGFLMYATPLMDFWRERSEVIVMAEHVAKLRAKGEEVPLPQTSWDLVIFGPR